MIMEYYDLLNQIQTQLNFAKIKSQESKLELEMESYILNDFFQKEYRLSEGILNKYSYLLPGKVKH
ncbi:hypothetical protein [Klebsiella quasipneumoniae]|uniref:hypothetical protein n=1 Tax=Klebsiella quasipneumoniae TaxID=1463165 RepID=UPI0025A097F5|nr:hypothetical protein [Klebsiella quasipneumoniae]MDM7180755.1 hypothetical protein [Klebsiella quasipneumoniae subsp. similipneumoniae]MDM7303491.1 hypothetical protein [Klebsiella quasipneumoniae subsp. similipneumoniae]